MRCSGFPPAGTGFSGEESVVLRLPEPSDCRAASVLKKGITDGGDALALSAKPQKGKNVALNKRPAYVWVEEDNKQVFLL